MVPGIATGVRANGRAMVVAMARKLGILRLVATAVPLASMLVVLTTVAMCLSLWHTQGHAVAGVIFPAISELGVALPERRIYQLGFATCGGLLSLSILIYEALVEVELIPFGETGLHASFKPGMRVKITGLKAAPQLNGTSGICQEWQSSSERWNVGLSTGEVKAVKPENMVSDNGSTEQLTSFRRCIWWAHASGVGVVLQGLVTLQHEIGWQNFIHWGGAILFMAGAMQHAKASNDLYSNAASRDAPLLQSRYVHGAYKLRCFILNYSSIVIFLIPLLAQAFPLAGSATSSANATQEDTPSAPMHSSTMNMMGLMQWMIILQFAVYFCTYTADMHSAANRVLTKVPTSRSSASPTPTPAQHSSGPASRAKFEMHSVWK